MNGTILLTGGTRGLGYATLEALLRADPSRHVILPARNLTAARAVTARLTAKYESKVSGSTNLHLVECDLGDLASIRKAAAEIGELLDQPGIPPLQVLAANAGVQRWREYATTADGFEVTFGTNLLGHYLLVRLLTERISRPGRIVLVSSSTHWGDFRHTWGMVAAPRWDAAEALARPAESARVASRAAATSAYSTSKLALIYLTHELARRLPEGVDVYSYNPGLIPGTGLAREAPGITMFLSRTVFQSVRLLPGAVGARTSGAELAETLTGPPPAPTGAYLDRGHPVDSSPESYDPDRERQLWLDSAHLVEIEP